MFTISLLHPGKDEVKDGINGHFAFKRGSSDDWRRREGGRGRDVKGNLVSSKPALSLSLKSLTIDVFRFERLELDGSGLDDISFKVVAIVFSQTSLFLEERIHSRERKRK